MGYLIQVFSLEQNLRITLAMSGFLRSTSGRSQVLFET